MKIKIILSVTLLVLVCSLFASFTSGNGTENDPYVISDATQFATISSHLGSHFKLASDITLTGDWTPLGTAEAPFTGSLDGDGKTVSGLVIDNNALDYAALFAFTSGATIKNLSLAGVNITGRNFVAGFVAKAENNTIIEECRIDGTVTGTAYVASIIAYSINSNITNSYSTANVSGDINVAGLVAVNSTESATGDMVFVLGGQFSPNGTGGAYDSGTYKVTLSSFYMSKYEVTQAEWASVMTGNSNGISAIPSHTSYGIGDTNPVNRVSWYDIMVYCNLRSIQEGLMPVYAKAGDINPNNWGNVPTSNYNADWDAITMNMSANGYRLPTEMEWEFAARGGVPAQQAGTFNTTYAGSNNADDVAWSWENNTPYGTKPVGTKAPNELGLYDMSGNVWELCWDWYASYPSGSFTDPVGPDSGSYRMGRGGSWSSIAVYCTVSYRSADGPSNRYISVGFRCVRSAD